MIEPLPMSKKIKKPSSEAGRMFAQRLIHGMARKGLGVKQAAEMIGVPASTISSWRQGSLPTQFDALNKLGEILDVSLTYLLVGEEPFSPKASVENAFVEADSIYDGYAHIRIVKLIPRSK
jgi:transcriptional regulator with XRE-family HTH domain